MALQILSKSDPAQFVSDRWYHAATDLGSNIQRWDSLQRQYRLGSANNLTPFSDERGRRFGSEQETSRISASVIYNTVETIAPRLMGLFSNDGWFSVTPRPRSNTSMDSARAVQDKLREHIDLNNMNTALRKGAKQTVKIGSAVFFVGWDIQEGKIHSVDGMSKRTDDGIVFNGATLKLWNYRDFYPDPKGYTIEECEYVITESTVPVSALEDRVKLGLYEASAVKKVKDHLVRSTSNDTTTFNRADYQVVDQHRNDVRVVSYWEDARFIFVAMPHNARSGAQGIVLNPKTQENPFDHQKKPFFQLKYTPDEDNFFPAGAIEAVRDDQELMSTFYRMAVEVGKRDIRPQRIIDKDLEVDVKELQNYVPDKITVTQSGIDGRISDHIHEFKPQVNGIMSLLPFLIGAVKQEAQEKTGVTATLTGQAGTGTTKTKGGLQLLNQNALNRGSDVVDTFAEDCLLGLDMMLSMSQQFGMPNEDIYGDYKLRAFMDSGVDKQSRSQVLRETIGLLQSVGGSPLEAIRRIYADAGIPSIDSLIPADEGERDANVQQQQQQQLLAQAQAGGRQPQGGGGVAQ
mgnify:CR=1 FL=1